MRFSSVLLNLRNQKSKGLGFSGSTTFPATTTRLSKVSMMKKTNGWSTLNLVAGFSDSGKFFDNGMLTLAAEKQIFSNDYLFIIRNT